MLLADYAREIAAFLGKPEAECLARLQRGFHYNHAAAAECWRKSNPQTPEEMLEWYRNTEAYIWELSCYHADDCDLFFNYTGMVQGFVDGLKARECHEAIVLGDGIGDVTIALHKSGIRAFYHDLKDSRTAEFAIRRFRNHCPNYAGWPFILSPGWNPGRTTYKFDAVIALDFLEHVTDVEAWTRAAVDALKPGGWLVVQNAFNCGNGPEGSIPMHPLENMRWEKDWVPLVESLGVEGSGNWWRKVG